MEFENSTFGYLLVPSVELTLLKVISEFYLLLAEITAIAQGENILLVGTWGPCSDVCSTGYRARSVLCVNPNGTLTEGDNDCPSISSYKTIENCGDLGCTGYTAEFGTY